MTSPWVSENGAAGMKAGAADFYQQQQQTQSAASSSTSISHVRSSKPAEQIDPFSGDKMERQQAFTTMLAAIVDELLDAMDNLEDVRTKLDTIQLCMILLTALLYVTVLLMLIAGLCYCVWRQNNPRAGGDQYYQAGESPSKHSRTAAGAAQKPLLMKYQNVNHSRYKDLPHFVVPNITVSENIDDSDDEKGGGIERFGEESGISVSGSPRTIRSASEKKLTSLPEEVV